MVKLIQYIRNKIDSTVPDIVFEEEHTCMYEILIHI
jgi:hypothetical protein